MRIKKYARIAIVLGCVIVYACGAALLLGITGCDDDGGGGSSTSAQSQTSSTDILPQDGPTTPPGPPVVPLPGAIVLGGIGVASVAWLRRQRKL